jgi:hypothetical protein
VRICAQRPWSRSSAGYNSNFFSSRPWTLKGTNSFSTHAKFKRIFSNLIIKHCNFFRIYGCQVESGKNAGAKLSRALK